MLKALTLEVKNIPCHDSTTYNFEGGISTIRGKNFSGKSVLFSTIGNLLFAAPPMVTKANQAKLLIKKGSEVHFTCMLGDTTYVFSQTNPTGGSVRYGVNIDGKEQEFKTIGAARDYIDRVVPITKEQFYSLSYLNAFRVHALQYGSGPDRRKFFEEVFSLDILDAIYRAVLEDQRPIKSGLSELETKQAMLNDMPDHSNLEIMTTQLEKRERKLHKVQVEFDEVSSVLELTSRRDTLRSSLFYDVSFKETKDSLAIVKTKIKEIKLSIEKARDYDTKDANYKAYLKRLKKIAAKLKENPKPKIKDDYLEKNLESLLSKQSSFEQLRTLAKDKKKYRKELLSLYSDWSIAIKTLGDKYKKLNLEELIKREVKVESTIHRESSLVTKLKRIAKEATCPTCDQDLNPNQTQSLIKKSKRDANRNRETLKLIRVGLTYLVAKSEYDKDYSEVTSSPEEYTSKLNIIEKKIKSTRKSLKQWVIHKRIIQAIADTDEVFKPEGKKPANVDKKLEDAIILRQTLTSDIKTLRSLKEIDKQVKDAGVSNPRTSIENLRSSLKNLRKKTDALAIQVAKASVEQKQFTKLKDEVDNLKEVTKNAEAYEILADTFGIEGLRVQQIERLSSMYIANMNKYAALIFPSPIEFSVDYSKNKFEILAERQGQISDVGLLSGSESRAFQLLSVLSILPVIPSNLRSNFLVMDEMESGLGKEMRSRFCSSFLPKLNAIVENLIIVTPMDQSELFIDGAKEYRMIPTKKKNINKLTPQS